ncbi:phosphoenolpyruvate carboxylase [Candidatus Woesearchaeota archaeon]|nr:MAG: phosphoenolpyruvate carboxylase [Candidatus Woesearchaeota archaeon]
MSTQHPDNVHPPFFSDSSVLSGEDEIKEAFYAFSHLKIREQLWDCEGKEVDNFVVKKLLSRYEPFFEANQLGRDRFLTLRVQNPDVEKNEAKILLETLESIPRNYDVANVFYQNNIPPIFEVTVPMVSSSDVLVRIHQYYRKFVSGKNSASLFENDVRISEWIGRFYPEDIIVTPLFEDMDSMLSADRITEDYMRRMKPLNGDRPYQRVWLARSDPALNYGSASAVLLEKVVLQRLKALEERTSTPILPILGCGSAPFRGHFTPETADQILKGYPSVHTFTAQSAFKYDYDESVVRKSVASISEARTSNPAPVEEEKVLPIIEKIKNQYQKDVALAAPFINDIAKFVPQRRKRVLHIGLFGYSRESAGIKLPRAIKFTASLYSLGIPPELLGLSALSEKDVEIILDSYKNFYFDHETAVRYFNRENLRILPPSLRKSVEKAASLFDSEPDEKHTKITSIIAKDYSKKNFAPMEENITRAATLRKFLG